MRLSLARGNLSRFLDMATLKTLERYSHFHPSPLTIKQFMEFGKSLETAKEKSSANFLRKELPLRLAIITKEMDLLPKKLLDTPSIFALQELFCRSFEQLLLFDSAELNEETLRNFCGTLETMKKDNKDVVWQMAKGVLDFHDQEDVQAYMDVSIEYFLDRFYMSLISLRMLVNQHVLLFAPGADQKTKRIGVIDPECKLKGVIHEAFQNAAFLCEEYYDTAPELELKGHTRVLNEKGKKVGVSVSYPPANLYHILFELFKNSMRATVETHHKAMSLPKIEVLLAKGEHDVSIRISDQGGGIPRHITDATFHYLVSTAPRPSFDNPAKAPLAGYGYGLPLSRLYARYFHGDLILNSYDGWGTDAVVYLKSLTHEAHELLPVFNKTSAKHYKTAIPTADWTDPTFTMTTASCYRPSNSSKPWSTSR